MVCYFARGPKQLGHLILDCVLQNYKSKQGFVSITCPFFPKALWFMFVIHKGFASFPLLPIESFLFPSSTKNPFSRKNKHFEKVSLMKYEWHFGQVQIFIRILLFMRVASCVTVLVIFHHWLTECQLTSHFSPVNTLLVLTCAICTSPAALLWQSPAKSLLKPTSEAGTGSLFKDWVSLIQICPLPWLPDSRPPSFSYSPWPSLHPNWLTLGALELTFSNAVDFHFTVSSQFGG